MCCIEKVRKSKREATQSVSIEYIPRNIETILYPRTQESLQQSSMSLNSFPVLNRHVSEAELPPSYPEATMKRSLA